jgi:anti-anti-sigma factor
MEYEEIKKGHYLVLEVKDKLDFFNINEFKKVLIEEILPSNTHVAVHLAGNINDISSSVISALIIAHKKLTALNGTFVLVDIGESAKNILAIAGLSGFFNHVNSYDELK